MIFSMKKKFDEKGIYWDRTNKGWMKTIVGLDKTKKNGYSLIGDFVNAGTRKNDYDAGLYLNCNKGEHIVYQLIKVTEDEDVILLQELTDPGRGWAVEFWEKIDENLDENALRPSYPDRFLNRMHLSAYLYHVGIIDIGRHVIEENMESDKGLDDRTFDMPQEISKYQDYLRCISRTLFDGLCDPKETVFEKINDINDLLNLNYLETLKSDKHLGVSFNVRTSEKYYNRQMIIIMTVKDGKYYVRWANHLL